MDVEFSAEKAVSRIAAAIGEPARARILYCLLDGHARTSTELAIVAEVSPSTASVHLTHLKDRGLVRVLAQGKHRYYSLDGAHTATALEALMVVAVGPDNRFVPNTPQRLRAARTCYDHLAGTIAVALHDRFEQLGWLIAMPAAISAKRGGSALRGATVAPSAGTMRAGGATVSPSAGASRGGGVTVSPSAGASRTGSATVSPSAGASRGSTTASPSVGAKRAAAPATGETSRAYDITPEGERALASLGIDITATRALRRRFAYGCVDWSERKPHIGGALGAELLKVALTRKWVSQDLDSRALRVTRSGQRELQHHFGVRL